MINTKVFAQEAAETAYCRTFQQGMKCANYVIGYRTAACIEGKGSLNRIPEILREKKLGKPMVVSDPNLEKIGLLKKLTDILDEAHTEYAVFTDVQPNPTTNDVENCYKAYKQNQCTCFIGFGGGAPMDCAKAAAAKSVHPHLSVAKLQGTLTVLKKVPYIIAVPTTAGTGSETTVAAVIVDSKTHHKASINDPVLTPQLAVLDPELTVNLPPKVTATTGMDALCHAVESYTNHTYNTALEDKLAIEAVKLIYDNLLTAYHDGQNIEARAAMQKAAFDAGRSFTRGCVGYVHAIGHTLGGLYGVPHGLAMSIILPHVLRAYGTAVYDRLTVLADACGIGGITTAQKAQNFIVWIEEMKKEMEIPEGADMIQEEDIPQIITWAMAEANPLYPTPVVWHREDFARVIKELRGE